MISLNEASVVLLLLIVFIIFLLVVRAHLPRDSLVHAASCRAL